MTKQQPNRKPLLLLHLLLELLLDDTTDLSGTVIIFDDDSITIQGGGASITDTGVTISAAGTYIRCPITGFEKPSAQLNHHQQI